MSLQNFSGVRICVDPVCQYSRTDHDRAPTDVDIFAQGLTKSISQPHLAVRDSSSDEDDHPLFTFCIGRTSGRGFVPCRSR